MNSNLKTVVVELAKVIVAIDSAVVHKMEGAGIVVMGRDLLPAIIGIPSALGSIADAMGEIKSITDEEKADLVEAVKKELDGLPQEKLNPLVDGVLDLVCRIWQLVDDVKVS
jgi:hypothetical protein